MSETATTSHGLLPGTQVVALYNYAGGGTKGDLRFAKGQLLDIAKGVPTDSNWLRARSSDGRQGLIPTNYVRAFTPGARPSTTLASHVWYHGHITRDRAEGLLEGRPDGTFLVRDSTNFPGDYTLCLACQGKVDHYRVYHRGNLYTCDDEEAFETLSLLCAHYKRDADGLSHCLVAPLPSMSTPSTPTTPLPPSPRPSVSPTNGVDIIDGASIVQSHKRMFTKNGWAIKRECIKMGETIGHGEFGDVLLGEYQGARVAVKCLKESSGVVAPLLEEAMLMQSLRHANLVALVGVVIDDPSSMLLVEEYMAEGNLVDYVRSRGRHALHGGQLFTFALDVCAGMAYLERCHLVHRDLAARNILLDDNLTAKVADFGLAKHEDTCATDATSGKFPIKWTAPEALRYSKFSSKSDVWSFGILLWEINSFGRVPYPRIPIEEVVGHIERGYRMDAPDGCPPKVARLMSLAWTIDVPSRPSFARLLELMRAMEEEMTDPGNVPPSPIVETSDHNEYDLADTPFTR